MKIACGIPVPRPSRSPDERVTPRLRLSRLRAGDEPLLVELHRDPQVMATLGGVRSAEETARFVQAALAHWAQHAFGLWIARDLRSGEFAGRGGLRRVEVEGRPEVEVAYAFRSSCWGRGLATELARASVRVAFSELGLVELVGFTLPTNHASQRVLAKAGFGFEREVVWAGLPHRLYRLHAAEGGADAASPGR